MSNTLTLHIESLIFAAEKAITIDDLHTVLSDTLQSIISPQDIIEAIDELKEKYSTDNYSFEIVEISGGFSFMTKGAYHLSIANYLKLTTTKRLSKAALETLSIITYKQPVSKSEIEHIRGVNCDYAVQKLLDKELVEIKGRSESVGKPLLYGTTDKFFDYFGLKGLQDLPKLKDFELPDDQIGSPLDFEGTAIINNEITDISSIKNPELELEDRETIIDNSAFADAELESEVFSFEDETTGQNFKSEEE